MGGLTDGLSEVFTIGGVAFRGGESKVTTVTAGGTTFDIDFDGTGANITRDGGGEMPEADFEALIRSITYENTSDDPTAGDRTASFRIYDGDDFSNWAVSTITVVPVNDAPVNTVPGAQSVNEDTSLLIAGISVNDVDNNLATTQLTVGNGTVNVNLAGGATISSGTNGSVTLTLSGTQAQINAALATVTYQGTLNFSGTDTLTVLSTDSAGIPLSDTDAVTINVNAVNEAPVNKIPGAQSVNEDTVLAIAASVLMMMIII